MTKPQTNELITAILSLDPVDIEFIDEARQRRFLCSSGDLKGLVAPQPALLFCPVYYVQHIDKAEPDTCQDCGHERGMHFGDTEICEVWVADNIMCGCEGFTAWLNPPHKKHRCHTCNHVWKPLLIPTNGVKSLEPFTALEEK